jgi:hypothetical protein
MIVGTITGMFTQGYIEVVGAHDQPTPVYMDCSGNPNPATGGRAYIGSEDVCEPLAIESSTWGRVKALYR